MRTSNTVIALGLLGLAVGLSPAVSFDGTRTPETAPVSAPLSGSAAPSVPGSNALGKATPLAPVTNSPSGIEENPHLPRSVPSRPLGPSNPFAAFRSGTQALREGRVDDALMELEFAAERGVPAAIWKLGK